jgi:hypothetical protein
MSGYRLRGRVRINQRRLDVAITLGLVEGKSRKVKTKNRERHYREGKNRL